MLKWIVVLVNFNNYVRFKLKALVLDAPNSISLKNIKSPKLSDGHDMILQVKSAAICGTDIRIYRGKKTKDVRYPSILGHEFSGILVDAGSNTQFKAGDRVAMCPFFACEQCAECLSGAENLCSMGMAMGYELDGAFAEYIRIPAAAVASGYVHHLPDSISFNEAALLEPFSCVINGQKNINLTSSDSVLVLGGGPIGQMHIKLAKIKGARKIILSDPNEHRRRAAVTYGADVTIDPSIKDIKEAVKQETAGRGADVVICAIGLPSLAEQSIALAAARGRVNLFAGFSHGDEAKLDVNDIHYREIFVSGAFGLSRNEFDEAFSLLKSGKLILSDLVTHELSIEQGLEAFALVESQQALKVILSN